MVTQLRTKMFQREPTGDIPGARSSGGDEAGAVPAKRREDQPEPPVQAGSLPVVAHGLAPRGLELPQLLRAGDGLLVLTALAPAAILPLALALAVVPAPALDATLAGLLRSHRRGEVVGEDPSSLEP